MRIATWNINGLKARLDFILIWLNEYQPDLLGLQELKQPDEQFPHEVFEKAGYVATTHGQKSWNGVAILSREPLETTQKGLPGQDELGARLITAKLGDLSFTTAYCPNGKSVEHDDFPRKLAWFDALAEHFEQTHDPAKKAVLCGDFNLCPAAIDSWNEEALRGRIFHTDGERARYQRLLDWGFRDTYRELYPQQQEFSWWDYRAGAFHKRQGLRIDLILATAPVMAETKEVAIHREFRKKKEGLTASDHAPVLMELGAATG